MAFHKHKGTLQKENKGQAKDSTQTKRKTKT
ncbi:unnamed protein product [Cuscuta europaea]|uniref:Uncharacterized protein n=1 Tax=Cuscuta europaea TaxID=41803 RepID=A0A9P1EM47_CUSEU|nr:unnamed protein product [Cuscuta europaea]